MRLHLKRTAMAWQDITRVRWWPNFVELRNDAGKIVIPLTQLDSESRAAILDALAERLGGRFDLDDATPYIEMRRKQARTALHVLLAVTVIGLSIQLLPPLRWPLVILAAALMLGCLYSQLRQAQVMKKAWLYPKDTLRDLMAK